MLLKIGDFARLSRVSVKTLRYYADIGLLKPWQVDQFSNYRYYAVDQLALIHRIVAYKELGLSLEQVKHMLDADLSLEQIQGMFELRAAELQQHIHDAAARLGQVQFRLRMLRMEAQMPTIDIQVTEVTPFTGLTNRGKIRVQPDTLNLGPNSEEDAARGRLLLEALSRYNLTFNPPVTIFYNFDPLAAYWDAKTILPLDTKPSEEIVLSDNTVLQWETIPGLPQAATYIFKGPYSQVPEQLLVVERWIAENGYHRGQQSRAIYHRGPMHFGPQHEFVTEIQIEIFPKAEEGSD
jgi:DNA-binding transcriptional MerR regulator/effector-binding domain-containing protein